MRLSLRARLLLAIGLVAVLALGAADIATYSSLRSFLLNRIDQDLQAAHVPIESSLTNATFPGGPGPGGGATSGQGLFRSAQGDFVALLNSNGSVASVDGSPAVQLLYGRDATAAQPRLPARITGFSSTSDERGEPTVYFNASSQTAGGPPFRVRADELSNGQILVIAAPLSDTVSTLHRLLLVELSVSGGALVLAGLVGWWLVRLGMKPLVAIERTATSIAGGELSQRVPGETRRTEVGRLAGALNVMLGRIEEAFNARDATESELRRSEGRLRRFVSDASHELRTPLAAVSAYAELFGRGADRRPEDLGRVMTGIRSEADRMSHLVDDLLMLARMDEGIPLDRAPVELVALAAEAAEAATTVGPEWPVRLTATEPVEVIGDRNRLRQVLDNLLSNVRSHTPAGTTAVVRVERQGSQAVIAVEDDGPGFDDQEAERLFERFYRSDASRSRSSGGTGLGLSIVEAIASAHHGTVEVRPRPGGGSVFAIRLPLFAASAPS